MAAHCEESESSTDLMLKNAKSFFSQDPTSTREQIASLDEQKLRSLRDQLHLQLVEVLLQGAP